jgi:hypothetical protein
MPERFGLACGRGRIRLPLGYEDRHAPLIDEKADAGVERVASALAT